MHDAHAIPGGMAEKIPRNTPEQCFIQMTARLLGTGLDARDRQCGIRICQNAQIGLQDVFCRLIKPPLFQIAARLHVGYGCIDISVTDDRLPRFECGHDHLMLMLNPIGERQQLYRAVVDLLVIPAIHHLLKQPRLSGEVGRLFDDKHFAPAGRFMQIPHRFIDQGRLSRAVRPFKDDEPARVCMALEFKFHLVSPPSVPW